MILDTSAILALLFKEEEASAMLTALEVNAKESLTIATPTYFETLMVVYRRLGEKGLEELSILGKELGWQLEPFYPHLVEAALNGYKRFHHGKNGLNFGDCFAYALAKARNEALLCKGDDFKHTDIQLVDY